MATIQNPFELPLPDTETPNELNRRHKNLPGATPVYLKATGEDATSAMDIGKYVNPELAMHSSYFSTLDKMMSCVAKNAHVTEPKA